MKGRVIDADTHKPIAGARVAIHDAPNVATKTDKDGQFDVERQRNYYAGMTVIGHGDDIPFGTVKHWSPSLDISAEGYSPREITATSSTSSYDQPNQCFILHDVLLERAPPKKPNQSPEPTR